MDLTNYLAITELPSKHRLYPELEKIYVRGLTFGEVMTLASFLDKEAEMLQVASSYQNIVKLFDSRNNEIPVTGLELCDFHYLLMTSSLLTEDSLSWNTNKTCSKCGHTENYTIDVSQIEYKHQVDGLRVPVPVNDKFIKPLTVGDRIKIDASERLRLLYIKNGYPELDSKSFKSILSYAVSYVYNTEEELIEIINNLNQQPKLYKLAKQINSELSVYLMPINLTCSECNQVNQTSYTFDDIKGYL